MAGAWESAEVSALIPPVHLDARVVYFPVRHHSPACAWHLERLLRELKPDAVLIEGPRDATPLMPLLADPELRTPVATYTTYVRRTADSLPQRHAGYYPLCDFSPELVAVRSGLEIGSRVRFIDLTFPENVEAGLQSPHAVSPPPRRRPQSLQDESWFSHSRLLKVACSRTGARDPDDLWDHLFELDFRERSTASFIRNVLLYCALARFDDGPLTLAGASCVAREQAMAAAIAEEAGRTVVVTGGFHTVALPTTAAALPAPLQIAAEDHQVVLTRYSFEQLDRLNGYASGMPSPEFYQRVWNKEDPSQILVEVARQCRQRDLGTSTADALSAVAHSRRLAHFRNHVQPSREDVLDGVRSTFVKGAIDAEGVAVLAIARKLLAGDRVGNVPLAAGQPPIVRDFRSTALELRLKLDKIDETEVALDLYRKTTHRSISRLFHRLALLEVPFAIFVRGPDFVTGEKLDRIQEVWTYHWSPQTESSLIERSLYGSTVEEASTGRLLELFHEEEEKGQGRSAAVAAKLVLQACRMGLHSHAQDLLRRVGGLVAEDSSFISLIEAMENLLVLDVSREPLEAHHLTGLHELATAAYQRACFLIPSLVNSPAEEEGPSLDALNALFQAVRSLGDDADLQHLRTGALAALAATSGGSAALRGGAVGALFGDGNVSNEELVRYLRGHLHSSREDGADGPNFLRGLLKTARSALWQVAEVLSEIDRVLRNWDEDRFVKMLPLMRMALAELTPRETDTVAKQVAALIGTEDLKVAYLPDFDSADMLRAVEVNRALRATLAADGLEVFCE